MINKLKAALELASHRADMWAEYARTGELQLDEFCESGDDEVINMAEMTANIVREAYAVLESTPRYSEHFGQRYCHPNVMDEAMVHNAMDIWEAVIMANENDLYQWFTQGDGRNEGVEIAMTMAPRFEQAWEPVCERFDGRPFDFEFVPPMLDLMYKASGDGAKAPYDFTQDELNTMAVTLVL